MEVNNPLMFRALFETLLIIAENTLRFILTTNMSPVHCILVNAMMDILKKSISRIFQKYKNNKEDNS